MRLVNAGGRAALLVGDAIFDLSDLSGRRIASDPMAVLRDHWEDAQDVASRGSFDGGVPVKDAAIGPPVPTPRAIFGLVANYPPAEATVLPMVFAKAPSAVVGPYDAIVLPNPERLPMKSEWTVLEAELAFVVGRGGRDIDPNEAFSVLAGYTGAQDITERVHEFGPRSTSVGVMEYASLKTLGKSLDTFCPLGPSLATLDEFDDPNDLALECRLNGEVVQKSSTREMLCSVSRLVSLLSSFVTLRPGDVCLTGTPTPVSGSLPRLRPGDVIETEIGGIGLMRNECVGAH